VPSKGAQNSADSFSWITARIAVGRAPTTVKRTTPPVTPRTLMFHRPGTTDGEDRQRQSKLEDDAADEQLNFGRVHRDR